VGAATAGAAAKAQVQQLAQKARPGGVASAAAATDESRLPLQLPRAPAPVPGAKGGGGGTDGCGSAAGLADLAKAVQEAAGGCLLAAAARKEVEAVAREAARARWDALGHGIAAADARLDLLEAES